MYEVIEHTADLGLRVRAPDLSTLFREAAEGFFSMILGDRSSVTSGREYRFRLESRRYDDLLVDWLNELLFVFDTGHRVLGRFEVDVEDGRLEARALGKRLDRSADRLLREIKAITYHGLRVEETGEGWIAEVIVDI